MHRSTRPAGLRRHRCALLAIIGALACCGHGPGRSSGLRDGGVETRPLRLPQPVRHVATKIVAGPRISATHLGSPHPARAAISVGRETWIATPAGVLRFDETLWHDPLHARPVGVIALSFGLPAAGVNALLSISSQSVLVATNRGLVRVDRRGAVRGPITFRGQRVTAVARALVGTPSGLYARRTGRPVPGGSALAVTALARCRRGTYVATQRHGLRLFRRGALRAVSGIPRIRVGALSPCDDRGRLLAASTSGIYRVVGGRAEHLALWRRHATAAIADGADAVIYGTFGEGLRRGSASGADVLLADERVHLVHRGARGLLVATARRLWVIPAAGREPVAVPVDGPPPGLITAIALDGPAIWVGTFDAGLARLQQGRWTKPAIFDQRITALVRDSRGRLFVGTAAGLGLLAADRVVRVKDPRGRLSHHIGALRRRGHEIWVGAHPGITIIDTRTDPPALRHLESPRDGLAGPAVYGMAFGPAGAAWVGTADGLSAIHGAQIRTLTDIGGVLPDNWINDVRSAPAGIYALTLRSGWLRIGPDVTEVWPSSLMTSPSAMLAFEDQLLFGSNERGLAAAPARGGPLLSELIRTWGPEQGLPSPLVAAIARDVHRDRLYVGGSAGLSIIENARETLALHERAEGGVQR